MPFGNLSIERLPRLTRRVVAGAAAYWSDLSGERFNEAKAIVNSIRIDFGMTCQVSGHWPHPGFASALGWSELIDHGVNAPDVPAIGCRRVVP